MQNLGINMLCGASSGIIGAAAGSPFFLVKTRLQSFSPYLPVGTQHKYRSWWHGLRSINSVEGISGLYRGVGAAMIRTGFGSSVQLPTYFLAKRTFTRHFDVEDSPYLHLGCSSVSGFVVCCVMHPPGGQPLILIRLNHRTILVPNASHLIDTIMSRLYNQNGNLYKGVVDCFMKTVKTEGVFAIYKGFLPHLARILPHTILTLTLAEQTNKFIKKIEESILPTTILE